jgi:hypothetical protein
VVCKGPPFTTLSAEALVEGTLAGLDDPEAGVAVAAVEVAVDVCDDDPFLLNWAAMDAATSLGTAELRTDIAFVVVGESELTIVVLWLLDNVVVGEYVLAIVVLWLLGNDDVVVVAMTACAAASPAPPEYEMKLVAKSVSPVNRGRVLRGWQYSREKSSTGKSILAEYSSFAICCG